jgi:hypothetical protein
MLVNVPVMDGALVPVGSPSGLGLGDHVLVGSSEMASDDSNKKQKKQLSLDRRIWRRLWSSPTKRNDYSLLELSRTWVRLGSRRATLACDNVSTLLPISVRNKGEG